MSKLNKFKFSENKKKCSNLSVLSAFGFISEHFCVLVSFIFSPVFRIHIHSSSLGIIF